MSDLKRTTLNAADVANMTAREVDDVEEIQVGESHVFMKKHRPTRCFWICWTLFLVYILALSVIAMTASLQLGAALDRADMLEKKLEAS